MIKDKISIIIPVYNVELYIRKCLDSIVLQTYKNLEIICIDDGSTDDSGKICDAYAKKDSRFRVVHKQNYGYPSALNVGLDIVTGEFIGFVDPDDWVEDDFYNSLYSNLQKWNVDISIVGYYRNLKDEDTYVKNEISIPEVPIRSRDALYYAFVRDKYRGFGTYLWNKLFSSRFISRYNGYGIRFDENLLVGCDVYFTAKCFLKSKGVIYSHKPYYHYLIRDNSLFHGKEINNREKGLLAYAKTLRLLEKNDIEEEILSFLKRFYVYQASLLAELSITLRNSQKLTYFQSEIKKYLSDYLKTNEKYPEREKYIREILNKKI